MNRFKYYNAYVYNSDTIYLNVQSELCLKWPHSIEDMDIVKKRKYYPVVLLCNNFHCIACNYYNNC